jgi:hypothetical protein
VLVGLDEGDAPRSTIEVRAGRAGEGDTADRERDPGDEECTQIVRTLEFRTCH